MYISNDINPLPRKDLDFKFYDENEEYESNWIEIVNNKNNHNTIAGVIYRHPSDSNHMFLTALKKTLKILNKEKKKNVIIAGDFNLDLLKYDNDICVSRFLNLMLENNLNPCITEPTRIIDTSKPSLIDNIFVNNINNTTSGNILEKISYDHLPNFVLFESENTHNIKNNIKTRDLKNFNKDTFIDELNNLNQQISPNQWILQLSS